MMLVSSSVMTHGPAAFPKLRYDMERDFAPMGSMTFTLAIKGETGTLDKYNDKFRELAKLRAEYARPGNCGDQITGPNTY